MRVGIYVRISDDREGRGLGVARQEGDCKQAITDPNGWTVTEVYVDNDRSAYSGKPRPSYRRMLADADAGRLDGIVAWHTDRLHRSPTELEEFIDVVERRGLAVQTVKAGMLDLSTPAGRMVARQLGAVARYESEHKSERQKAKARQIALAGGVSGGGTRPFGYEDDRVTVRESEAELAREIAGRLLGGESIRGVCADLNARGLLSPGGTTWKATPLRRVMTSYRLAGKREHKGEMVADAVWPAILDLEQTIALRRLLLDPDRRGRPPRRYLLKGLLVCSSCGQVLVARPRQDGARCYVCASGRRDAGNKGCGKRRVLAETVEEFVTEAVFARLDSPGLAAALKASVLPIDDGGAQRRADNALLRLDELASTYADGGITMREWLTAREPLERALERARAEIAERAGVGAAGQFIGEAGKLREAWPDMDVDRRNTIVGSLVERVIVMPGRRGYNRFDPSRFEIVFRF